MGSILSAIVFVVILALTGFLWHRVVLKKSILIGIFAALISCFLLVGLMDIWIVPLRDKSTLPFAVVITVLYIGIPVLVFLMSRKMSKKTPHVR